MTSRPHPRILLRLLSLLRPYRIRLMLAAIALLVASGSVLLMGQGLKLVIDQGFIAEDVGYRYAGEEAEDGAAASEMAAIEALSSGVGSGRMHAAYELASEVPVAWLTAGGMLVCCLLAVCACICLRSRQKRRRRRAQLEDVQTVFHTETWRKLE